MKVGILTFPHSPSLGAMLQMGALYNTIKELGHDVYIINYVSDNVNHKQKRAITLKSLAIIGVSRVFLKNSLPSYKDFESKMRMFPEQPIKTDKELENISSYFDRIIVGSDQVWNPVVTGHDLNFYLKFCKEDNKKASYAASFGYMHADQEYESEIAKLLKSFSHISVRERDGIEIVKRLSGQEARLVLDPTLLVNREYLYRIMKKTSRKRKYVLFFCIKPSSSLYVYAKKYADAYGYELVTIGGRIKDRFDPTKHPEFGVGPQEFLGLIEKAECVFTNSFHGSAVSIAFHTDFYVEFSSDTNSRLINLMELFQLQDRVISNEVITEKHIDYNNVDNILSVWRNYSLKYLNEVLEE